MADLITHGAVALMVKAATRVRMVSVFVAGTLLPDVASRVPSIGLGLVHVHILRVPEWMLFAWEPLHQPVGMVLLSYFLAMLFSAQVRTSVFLNLLGGMALHMMLDLLQSHHGAGYMLMFPFGISSFEFGWMGSEATVPVSIPLGLLSIWLVRKRSQAVSMVHKQ